MEKRLELERITPSWNILEFEQSELQLIHETLSSGFVANPDFVDAKAVTVMLTWDLKLMGDTLKPSCFMAGIHPAASSEEH